MWTQFYCNRKTKPKLTFILAFTFSLSFILSSCERSEDKGMYTGYNFEFTLEGVTSNVYVSHDPELKEFPLVLFLHGAGCGTIEHIHPASRRYLKDAGAGVLTIDKPGAYYGTKQIISLIHCSKKYYSLNYPSKRAEHLLNSIEKLNGKVPGWNGQLYIVSAHEGVIAASLIATKLNAKGLAVLGTGEGFSESNSFKDLTLCLKEKRTACNDFQGSEEVLKASISKDTNNRINYRGIRGTGAWWNEMLSSKTSENLKEFKGQVLIIHAGRDTTIDIKSAELLNKNLLNAGLKGVTYKPYPELDGGFMDPSEDNQKHKIQLEISNWIRNQTNKI